MLATKIIPYEDMTEEWLRKSTPNNHKIIIDDYFMTSDGIKHPVRGQEKINMAKTDNKEYKMVDLLEKTLGGSIHFVPRIETQKGYKGLIKVSTPDYRWNRSKIVRIYSKK